MDLCFCVWLFFSVRVLKLNGWFIYHLLWKKAQNGKTVLFLGPSVLALSKYGMLRMVFRSLERDWDEEEWQADWNTHLLDERLETRYKGIILLIMLLIMLLVEEVVFAADVLVLVLCRIIKSLSFNFLIFMLFNIGSFRNVSLKQVLLAWNLWSGKTWIKLFQIQRQSYLRERITAGPDGIRYEYERDKQTDRQSDWLSETERWKARLTDRQLFEQ